MSMSNGKKSATSMQGPKNHRHSHTPLENRKSTHTNMQISSPIHKSKQRNSNRSKSVSKDIRIEYTLNLEEKKNLPIFWNGSETVSKLTWTFSPKNHNLNLNSHTIGEVLEKFTAQDYLRHCKISIYYPANSHIVIHSGVHLSDTFLALFPQKADNKASRNVIITLNQVSAPDLSREISNKYVLIMSEVNNNKILWDGMKPVSNMIARVGEHQMLVTIGKTLKRYLPSEYLKNNLKIEVVTDKRSMDKVKEVKTDDILGSLFNGMSATIRLCHTDGTDESNPIFDNQDIQNDGELDKPKEDYFSATDIKTRSMESFWLSGNWNEIREKTQYLFEALEVLQKERLVPAYYESRLLIEKRNLETAMRRRSRSIDEVWRRYEVLKTTVEEATYAFKYKKIKDLNTTRIEVTESTSMLSSLPQTAPEPSPPSESYDSFNLPRIASMHHNLHSPSVGISVLDGFASTMRRYGVEIYDEDSSISPIAGMAFTIALVVVVCVMSQCMN